MTTFTSSSVSAQAADHERPTVPGRALPGGGWAANGAPNYGMEEDAPAADLNIVVFAPPPLAGLPTQELAAEHAVRWLGTGRSPEEACRALCEQHGYPCEQAQRLVSQVAAQQRVRIARRQAPFLLLLGITTLLGGLALLGLGVMRLRGLGSTPAPPIYIRTMVTALVSGALMVLGAGVGLAEVLGSLRK